MCSLLLVVTFLRGCMGMSILRPILWFQAGWIFRSSDRITICFICSWSFKSSTVDNSVAITYDICNYGVKNAVMVLACASITALQLYQQGSMGAHRSLGSAAKTCGCQGWDHECLFSLFGLESKYSGVITTNVPL